MAQHGPGTQQRQQASIVSHINIGGGLGRGIGIFFLAYLIMFVFFFVEMGSAGGMRGSGLVLIVAPLGFLFSSHIGAVPGPFAGGMGSFLTIPVFVYFLVPIVLLVWGGYTLSRKVDAPSAGARVAAGASVTIGYVAGVILTFILLSLLPGARLMQFSQRLAQVVIVAGVVYPLVFGSAGGVLAHVLSDDPKGAGAAGAGGQPAAQPGGQPRGAAQQQAAQPQAAQPQGQPQSQAGTQPPNPGQGQGSQQPTGGAHQPSCPECGAAVDPGGNFCRSCGAEI